MVCEFFSIWFAGLCWLRILPSLLYGIDFIFLIFVVFFNVFQSCQPCCKYAEIRNVLLDCEGHVKLTDFGFAKVRAETSSSWFFFGGVNLEDLGWFGMLDPINATLRIAIARWLKRGPGHFVAPPSDLVVCRKRTKGSKPIWISLPFLRKRKPRGFLILILQMALALVWELLLHLPCCH